MIDHNKVMQLYRRGQGYHEISLRLGCSEKQIGRIVRGRANALDKTMRRYARSGAEILTWYAMVTEGIPLGTIAALSGVSAQFVEEAIAGYLHTERIAG